MRILLVLTPFALVALVSSASSNEKYNDNQKVRPVLNMDGKRRANSVRYPIRDDKSNKDSKDFNQGIVRNNQPDYNAGRTNSVASQGAYQSDRGDFGRVSNNYGHGAFNYRSDNADIWDLYHSKNLDTWRKMQSGSQEKYGQFDAVADGRYKAVGRHGLGFEQRTATSYGLRAPLTLNQIQVVGKGEGSSGCRCS